MNLSSNLLSQRITRRALNDLLGKIAGFFGIVEQVLADQKLTDDEVLNRVRLAKKAEAREMHGVEVGRVAFDEVKGPDGKVMPFGRGKWALLSQTEPIHPGNLVAYRTDDGYVVRQLGDAQDRHVVLIHPHIHTKTEIKSKQWASANLKRVLGICDMV